MKAIVFSGTTEGKTISEYLNSKEIFTEVFVATDYGKAVMSDMKYVRINVGRLDKAEIKRVVFNSDFVIDATHPFAEIVTKNISCACDEIGIQYIRLLREESFKDKEEIISVGSIEQAVDFLKNTTGNVFVSTGSKELHKYCEIDGYAKRIIPRVLPIQESEEKCSELKFENVIYKKGPFSYFENIAEFKKYDIKWLVTKNSGKNGGFDEKINAAKDMGINTIVIQRPFEKNGLSMEEVKKIIDDKVNNIYNMKFPLFIDIYGKNAVVIGGGKIAVRRINTLLKFGARVKVIAPEFDRTKVYGDVIYFKRKFQPSDLDGAFIVIGATNDRNVNHFIYTLCKDKNILYSIADCKEECNFYFPAVCVNNELSIGIVSDGNNHSLVKKTAADIRRLIDNA